MRDENDLVSRLWASDAASALTNEAAREIERLGAVLQAIYDRCRESVNPAATDAANMAFREINRNT
jgi:hypothetical protein